MVSLYYTQATVKSDLRITDTGNDTQLDSWSDDAEGEIDDIIYDVWSKTRDLQQLPALPLTGVDITKSIISSANHRVKAKYYEFTKNFESAKFHYSESLKGVDQFVGRQETEREFYGRIIS